METVIATSTIGVEHTNEHTLKEILSAWLLKYGVSEVDRIILIDDNIFTQLQSSPYYFFWREAVDAGLIQELTPRKLSLTQKALDYIQQEDTP